MIYEYRALDMPTRLTEVVVKEGALVDRGDSPKAFFSFWKRHNPGAPMDPKEKAAIEKAATEVADKAHADEIAKRDTELQTVRKELADAKASFAVEIAKFKKDEKPAEAPLPAEFQKRLDAADAARVDLEKRLADETERREVRESVEKAARFTLPVKTEALAKALRLIRKALPEADAVVVEQALEAVSNQTKENAQLLQEIGRAGLNVDANAPQAQLDAMVEKYARENKVTKSVAFLEVTKSGDGAVLMNKVRKDEIEADKARS